LDVALPRRAARSAYFARPRGRGFDGGRRGQVHADGGGYWLRPSDRRLAPPTALQDRRHRGRQLAQCQLFATSENTTASHNSTLTITAAAAAAVSINVLLLALAIS